MTANPLIDQYAADVRKRHAAQSPKARLGIRRISRRAAGDIHADLPDISSEQLGAVLLRVAGFAHNVSAAQPGATAREIAAVLEAAGEWLYHHGDDEPADIAGCEHLEVLGVPERERLVHDDPELAARIRQGIDEAERGETRDLGSFAKYLNDGDDDE